MSEPTISIEGLGKAYTLYARPSDRFLDAFGLLRFLPRRRAACADFWALRDLNLVINKGERIGFVGRNGAGKSTLLKLIAGTVAPTEGQLSVNGQVQALMELGTGFHPDFTGRQNIAASLAYQGLSTREIRTLEEEIIDFAELDEFIDQPIKSYSAGMYARLAFSTATSILPEILIIDEILGAGDAYFAGKCMERMRQLTTRDGVTVLFVSHDISSVQQLCTRAVWIDRGCVQADGDTVEVVKAYYRSIQREDALRRRAKAMGLRKSRNLDGLEKQISSRTLFRFLVAGRPPEYRHKIRRLGLSNAGELISELHVGAPMDNSQDALDRLLDAPGYMEWSRAQRDVDGAFRWFEASAGEYQHAPFELGVPVANLESPEGEFELIVEGEFDPRESVRLEMYSGEAYRLIAEIQGLQGEAAFPVPHLTESAEPAAGRSEDTGANKMSDDPHPVEATGHASTPAAPAPSWIGRSRILPLKACDFWILMATRSRASRSCRI
ncbi:MAG: ABC transporter ATP-binding protein [Pseudomonadales bacterium]